jgi:hypothetical protein
MPRRPLAAALLCLTASAGAAQDSAEQVAFFDSTAAQIRDQLCQEGPYLTCLQIPSGQCFAELQPVVAGCRARMLPGMPALAEESINDMRVFWERFGYCVMDAHLASGNFDRGSAEDCLDPP